MLKRTANPSCKTKSIPQTSAYFPDISWKEIWQQWAKYQTIEVLD
jgi:hypothetical protein